MTKRGSVTVGSRVRVTATMRGNVLAPGFPGWGHPEYAKYLRRPATGLLGTVTDVQSHGSNPYTRYVVKFDDGSRGIGLTLPGDLELVR